MTAEAPALGYFWGDDEYALDHAAERLATGLAETAGLPVERWRVRGDAITVADLAERVGTAPFFGGGTLVLVSDPTPLARGKQDRAALEGVMQCIAPGNGLAFLETLDPSGRRPAALEALAALVAAAGGSVREFRAPRERQMVSWVEQRASELGVRLGRGAAQELAGRVGAFVREGDIDRRRQGRLVVSELEKLRLFRPAAEVSVEDVRALVPEAIPGSMWAFLDALAARQVPETVTLAERLIEATPPPVLLAVMHRRIRELVQVADLVAGGATGADVIRTLKMKSYPAEKLARLSANWSIAELEAALEGLLELDVAIKGSDGQVASDAQVRLALTVWIAEHVARREPVRR